MTYVKPELAVLRSALAAIQGTGDSKALEPQQDSNVPTFTSINAYEADE